MGQARLTEIEQERVAVEEARWEAAEAQARVVTAYVRSVVKSQHTKAAYRVVIWTAQNAEQKWFVIRDN